MGPFTSMARASSTEHVVCERSLAHWRCLRCWADYEMAMPVPMSVFTAACLAFTRIHQRCLAYGPQKKPRAKRSSGGP